MEQKFEGKVSQTMYLFLTCGVFFIRCWKNLEVLPGLGCPANKINAVVAVPSEAVAAEWSVGVHV